MVFFAYRQKHKLHKSSALSVYLDTYLRLGNQFSQDTLSILESLFVETITIIEDTFGVNAFCLWRQRGGNWSWYDRPTTTIYDPLMFVMSNHLAQSETIRAKSLQFKKKITQFYAKHYAVFEGRNVNITALKERERKFEEFIDETLAEE